MTTIRAASTLIAFLVLAGTAPAQYQFSLDPKNTYLHTNQDKSGDAVPVDLASLGITEGMHLRLRQPGDYDNGPNDDTFPSLAGIFSATSTLLDESNLDRVADAIDAGFDFQSRPTYFGSQATDVPEDFAITHGTQLDVTVTVPSGAAYLFLTPDDIWFQDNTDPDGDYGVLLDVIGPGTFVDLGNGLAGVSGVPALAGSGTVIAADPISVTLSNAKANSLSFLILGFSRIDAPFKGGVLVPAVHLLFPIPTDGAGGFQLQTLFPAGVPADFHFYMQTWIVDPAGVKGMSASNALEVITP
jgi:hypothetical protein